MMKAYEGKVTYAPLVTVDLVDDAQYENPIQSIPSTAGGVMPQALHKEDD